MGLFLIDVYLSQKDWSWINSESFLWEEVKIAFLVHCSKMKAEREYDCQLQFGGSTKEEGVQQKLNVNVGIKTNGYKLAVNKFRLEITRKFTTIEGLEQPPRVISQGKQPNQFYGGA